MKSTIVSFLVVLSMVFACCHTQDTPITPSSLSPKQIFPLAVGNYWVRERIVYDTVGVATGSQIDTVKVLGDTVLHDEKCFIISRDGGRDFVTNRSDGLWLVGLGSASLQYEYPGYSGDAFVFATNTSPVRVVCTDSSIAVPAGTFRCYVYETSISYSTLRVKWSECLCPGIGFVFAESRQSQDDTSRLYLYGRIRLLSYYLN
jgi:hypothetical protein